MRDDRGMGVIGGVNQLLARVVVWIVDLFYVEPLRRYIPQHTFRYLACGVGNYFILDSILYFVLYNYVVGHNYFDLGIFVISPHVLAMVILFPITFFTGFWLNRYVAFGATQQRARVQVMKYGLTILGSLAISYIVLKSLVEGVGVWPTPAKVLSSVVTAVYSYLAARYFTFRK